MKEKNFKDHLTVWIIVTVIVAGVSYYGGNVHGKSVALVSGAGQGQFRGGGAMGAAGSRTRAGGAISGDVLSMDNTSLTVKMRDGSTKIIFYSGTTTVMKTAAGTIGDVAVGSTIMAQGTPNSDGSVTAQSIQIRPAMPAGIGGKATQ